MNKAERAIILAAGQGKRLRPITSTCPKSLVTVNGVAMLETSLGALQQNGIEEIWIVVGYLKEMFQPLTKRYKGINLIENPYYASANNVSSLYAARAYLQNTIVMDADLIIRNPSILAPHFPCSGYNAIWTDTPTSEWLLTLDADQKISHCSKTGGNKGWQLFSISRWSAEDGGRLARHLQREFIDNQNGQIYWDDIPLFLYPKEYQLGICAMERFDITEIDTLAELAAVDPSYRKYGLEKNNGEA